MDPTAVTTNPILSLIGFILLVILLLFLIAKWKWHVFLALLIPIMIFGIIPGVQLNNFVSAFETGFGKTLGKIGVVIVLGSIIAEALKHTGAINIITNSIIKFVGKNRMPLALTVTGFILGIAIFSDVAYVILNPLVHASALATGTGIAVMSTGLVGALQLTHAIVPPTPGPLAATALLGADLGKTIFYGSVACFFGSTASWIWGQYIVGPRIHTLPSSEFSGEEIIVEKSKGSSIKAFAPIIVPVILIVGQSISKIILPEDNLIRIILQYLGWPVVALSIGVILAYLNIKNKEHKKDSTSKWIESALRVSAMILVVTGLGGSLSEILKGTPVVNYVVAFFQGFQVPFLLLPFVIGIIGNMITGSTTVGVITAASITAPMLSQLGLSPEAAMLSGASGSVMIKYVNSSYFWICTSLSKLPVNDAIKAYGGATFVGGLFSFITVWVLWQFGLI